MRYLFSTALGLTLLCAAPVVLAQDVSPPQNNAPQVGPNTDPPAVPDIAPTPEQAPDDTDEQAPTDETPPGETPPDVIVNPTVPIDDLMGEIITAERAVPVAPDYSKLTEAQERKARLDVLFVRLAEEENAETADLIAESIWAIWLDSGSDSVNLLLRRGTAAEKRSDYKLARQLYDHVTTLNPDYAEGWSRSARLAIVEEDLSRALSEVTKALILEERHFYGLWTLGNIFERIGKTDAALEAYREAAKLYPELKAVKDRISVLGGSDEGQVL